MHQSIILSAPNGADILGFIDSVVPGKKHVETLEDRIPEGRKTSHISVGDIRDLREQLITHPFKDGTTRVIVLRDAALMRIEAQNAFLKHLEEPGRGVVFILATPSPGLLLETVKSRCVFFELPSTKSKSTDPQIAFMSKGDSFEMERLTKDKRYHKQKVESYTDAKVLIGGSKLDKLRVVLSISSKREYALDVITASLHMIRVQIKSKYDPSLVRQADRLIVAYDRIKANGNVKLQLLNSVI